MDITETARYFNGLEDFKGSVRKGVLNLVNDLDDSGVIYQDTGNGRKLFYKKNGYNYFVVDHFKGKVNVYSGEYIPSDRLPPEVAASFSLLIMQSDTEYLDLPKILSFNENVDYHFNDDDISEFTTVFLCRTQEEFSSIKKKSPMFEKFGNEDDFEKLKTHEIKDKYWKIVQQYFEDTFLAHNSADLFNLTEMLQKEKYLPKNKMFSIQSYRDCNNFIGITYDCVSHKIVDNIDKIYSSVDKLDGKSLSNEIWKDDKRLFIVKDNLVMIIDKDKDNTPGSYIVFMRENDSVSNFVKNIDQGEVNTLSEVVMTWNDYLLIQAQEAEYSVADLMLKEALVKLDDCGVVNNKDRNMKLN